MLRDISRPAVSTKSDAGVITQADPALPPTVARLTPPAINAPRSSAPGRRRLGQARRRHKAPASSPIITGRFTGERVIPYLPWPGGLLRPYGLVAHSGRWYVTGTDPGIGEDRTFRLDRIVDARTLPGSFEPPAGLDPAQRVLSGLAKAPYRHQVILRIQGTVEQIRARLPASVASVAEPPSAGAADLQTERWLHVELRAERLDWLPAVLASLDLPFIIERPDDLRGLVTALADRLAASARRSQIT
jgi:hypothetical protein